MVALFIFLSVGACNYGDNVLPQRFSKVTLYGIAITSENGPSNNIKVGSFIINNFQVGTQEIDMSFASSTEFGLGSNINNVTIRSNAEEELGVSASKPQINTLISSGDHRTAVIGEGSTPNGNYTEVTFQLYQNKNAPSSSFTRDKSLYILGLYEGKPVRMWLTTEESLRATADTPNGYRISSNADLILRFNLDKLLENIDFDKARDRNSDGFIDIGPNNVDSNGEIYTTFRTNLINAIEFAN